MATERAEDEIEGTRGIVDRVAKAEAKKERRVFIDAIVKRRGILKERADRKRLRKEVCKEVTRAKRGGNPPSFLARSHRHTPKACVSAQTHFLFTTPHNSPNLNTQCLTT